MNSVCRDNVKWIAEGMVILGLGGVGLCVSIVGFVDSIWLGLTGKLSLLAFLYLANPFFFGLFAISVGLVLLAGVLGVIVLVSKPRGRLRGYHRPMIGTITVPGAWRRNAVTERWVPPNPSYIANGETIEMGSHGRGAHRK